MTLVSLRWSAWYVRDLTVTRCSYLSSRKMITQRHKMNAQTHSWERKKIVCIYIFSVKTQHGNKQGRALFYSIYLIRHFSSMLFRRSYIYIYIYIYNPRSLVNHSFILHRYSVYCIVLTCRLNFRKFKYYLGTPLQFLWKKTILANRTRMRFFVGVVVGMCRYRRRYEGYW